MPIINPTMIERYQLMLKKEPKSKVFAPLVEAYRKMNLLDQAIQLGEQGISYHPNFTTGRVALGKAYFDNEDFDQAKEQFQITTELSPENILAHSLLAQVYLELGNPKEALKSFKMVLFLSPNNQEANNAVKKLESLTADEFADEIFSMQRISHIKKEDTVVIPENAETSEELLPRSVERIISLADAFIIRNDIEQAGNILREGAKEFGLHPEIEKRIKMVEKRGEDSEDFEEEKQNPESLEPIDRHQLVREAKMRRLNALLSRIESRKRESGSLSPST